MDSNFEHAFNHAMLYEVGGFWNPNDPDVINGSLGTKELNRKVGYVNIPADRGGETKYGIAQKSNPTINVRGLNLDDAMDVYYNKYWLTGKCDKLPYPLTILHFDGCVNHGPKKANIFLQRSLGVTADGDIGNQTLNAVNQADLRQLIISLANARANFYQSIVNNDPSQGIFLKGWMRRIDEVKSFTLSVL